jgi:cellulose synthase/poly-beta-1,6-N-acetylglucosamine synthase-like glycosyltransferase
MISTILVVIVILRQLLGILGISRSHRFLTEPHQNEKLESVELARVLIVIPVLRESRIIEDTLRYFGSLDYPFLAIIVVTSERERIESDGSVTTMDTLNGLVHKYKFSWLHCSVANATKADQLNYALEHWRKVLGYQSPDDVFVALYDADSRPDPGVFSKLSSLSQQNQFVNVFQQSALFKVERNDSCNNNAAWATLVRLFQRANVLRANRFVFAYEIPRILNRLDYYKKRASLSAVLGGLTYAHCVGHGLFIRSSFTERLRFPANSIMEDMQYGFLLNVLKEPVVPIPLLDRSEVPSNAKNLFFQMSRWFLGPSRTAYYLSYALKEIEGTRLTIGAVILVISGWFISAAWLLLAPVFGAALVTSALALSQLLLAKSISNQLLASGAIALAFLLIYFFSIGFTVFVQNTVCSKTGRFGRQGIATFRQNLPVFLVYPLVTFFHSSAAYYCLYDLIVHKGRNSLQRKTERE